MSTKISIDQAGRVVIPKRAREALGIAAGDMLEMTFDNEGLTLRPERHSVVLQKERGIWVFGTGVVLTQEEANEAVDAVRSQRNFAQ